MLKSLVSLQICIAALSWSTSVNAQVSRMKVIGFLSGGVQETNVHTLAGFRNGLKRMGYIEGKNVKVEYRWANQDRSKLRRYALEFVKNKVDVIVASGGQSPITAAMEATQTIPVIFGTGSDPIAEGMVKSLGRPKGNVTGASFYSDHLASKMLGYIRESIPHARRILAIIHNEYRAARSMDDEKRDITLIAQKLGLEITYMDVRNRADVEIRLKEIDRNSFDAMLVGPGPLLNILRRDVISAANAARMPVFARTLDYAPEGGFISYGAKREDMFFEVGRYTGRVLRGAKPSELPVLLPRRYELILNLRAARMIGIMVQPSILAVADEVLD